MECDIETIKIMTLQLDAAEMSYLKDMCKLCCEHDGVMHEQVVRFAQKLEGYIDDVKQT